jgi:hypothetical protein
MLNGHSRAADLKTLMTQQADECLRIAAEHECEMARHSVHSPEWKAAANRRHLAFVAALQWEQDAQNAQ